MNQCIDCGREVKGVRCRRCNGRHQAIEAARALAKEDAALLAMKDTDELSDERIAARTGISRSRVWQRVSDARRRQALLAEVAA